MKTVKHDRLDVDKLVGQVFEYAQSSGVIKITDKPTAAELTDHHLTGMLTLGLLLAPFLL